MAVARDKRLRQQIAAVLARLRAQTPAELRRAPARREERSRFQGRVTAVTTFHAALSDGRHRFVVRGLVEETSDPQIIAEGFDVDPDGSLRAVPPAELYGFVEPKHAHPPGSTPEKNALWAGGAANSEH